LCCVVLCCVVLCCVVWCGVVWCGVVWRGVVCELSACAEAIALPTLQARVNVALRSTSLVQTAQTSEHYEEGPRTSFPLTGGSPASMRSAFIFPLFATA
jgi:hypothetical protein